MLRRSNPFTCWRALSVTNASQVAAAPRRFAGVALCRRCSLQALCVAVTRSQAEAAVLKYKETIKKELVLAGVGTNAGCAVVCCSTAANGRQPFAAAAVQTRHPDCSIIMAAGMSQAAMRPWSDMLLSRLRTRVFCVTRRP